MFLKDEKHLNDYTCHVDSASASNESWCLFRSGSGNFAIPLEVVGEVVEVERLVRLPHSPPQILGLCTLRREIVPVIGLEQSVTTVDTAGAGSKATVLVLKTVRGRWGIRVNPEGTTVAEEPVDIPTSDSAELSHPGLAISGTITRGPLVYAVVDPDATWNYVRVRVEEWYRNHWGRSPSNMSDGRQTMVGLERIAVTEAVR